MAQGGGSSPDIPYRAHKRKVPEVFDLTCYLVFREQAQRD
jgi:hypothetical protein